jgi:hypothetical protein
MSVRLDAGFLVLSARHGRVRPVKIYVAGPLADVATVRAVQSTVVAAGHDLTLDWTEDASLVADYGSQLDVSGRLAEEELNAVMAADAVLVIASEHDGRGMFVELGAALHGLSRENSRMSSSWARSGTRASSTSTPWSNVWPASRTGLDTCAEHYPSAAVPDVHGRRSGHLTNSSATMNSAPVATTPAMATRKLAISRLVSRNEPSRRISHFRTRPTTAPIPAKMATPKVRSVDATTSRSTSGFVVLMPR